MKLENKITAELMKANRLPPVAWEVKRTVGKSLPFSSFADHQITNLLKAKRQRLNLKIRDVGVARKEFDGLTLDHSPAWCVCCYPADNKDGYNCYAIDIDVWYNERRTCDRKSLIEERAKSLGTLI
jgi:hypothetical protein